MTAPADFDRALADARRRSPDLMSIDDKCDVVFGRPDEPTRAWVTASLAIGKADCVRRSK